MTQLSRQVKSSTKSNQTQKMLEQHWRKELSDVWGERLEKSLDLKQDKTIYLVARELGRDEINKFLWIGETDPTPVKARRRP